MFTNVQHFQFLKLFCILAVIASAHVMLKVTKPPAGITLTHCVLIVMALWAALSGFVVERRIADRAETLRGSSSRSTPLSRWRASNITRAMSATSVALWGLILRESGGPVLVSYLFLGLGVLLLSVWKPSASPKEAARNAGR